MNNLTTSIESYKKDKFPFETYLKDKHAEDYQGTDDDMSDSFDGWLMDLDVDTLINYGDSFARELLANIKS